ncbi:pentapeptide repeat-containing protein [Nonomuraea sp. NPDC050556]|uniref:pentapeptide repeat-containing protein n=1 Tax=Nonomuraea sp. NPDC050556 TaxID=3364369 RepID=UPI0037ACE3DB
MKPVSMVVAAVGVVLVAGIVWVLGPGARWVLEHIDGVTIGGPAGLVGKDLAAALDAVRGRVLAVATGLAALVAVYYTARNADTARRTFQLGERGHVTDRYGKAVEQLGSAQAPVRLGGLYALDQLGQDNPSPALRQTIVDVICAYLRMPYTPPLDQTGQSEPAEPGAVDSGVSAPVARDPHEERQVRLTAQRVLTAHLRYEDPPAHRWWQPSTADPNARHWTDVRLDLTGATLLDFDLNRCRVGDAGFDKATFSGDAVFDGATFTGHARFDKATFTGDAWFGEATFSSVAWFDKATFTGQAGFGKVTFTREARFGKVTFTGDARFTKATFSSVAIFDKATFTRNTDFGKVTFTRDAWFGEATFTRDAGFGEATFTGDVWFGKATFTGHARFDMATFTGHARFDKVTFTRGAMFDGATFTRDAGFREATFTRVAGFGKATFTGHARFDMATFTGDTWFSQAKGLEAALLVGVRVTPAAAGVRWVWPPCWRVEADADGWRTLRLAEPEPGSTAGGEKEGPTGAAEG